MLRAVDTLELCLVCEVCWRPQRDDDPNLNCAYDVTTQSDLCAKVGGSSTPTRCTRCLTLSSIVWHR